MMVNSELKLPSCMIGWSWYHDDGRMMIKITTIILRHEKSSSHFVRCSTSNVVDIRMKKHRIAVVDVITTKTHQQDTLPRAIWALICSYISVVDHLQVLLVCSALHSAASLDSSWCPSFAYHELPKYNNDKRLDR